MTAAGPAERGLALGFGVEPTWFSRAMLARVLHDSANQKSGRPSAGGCNWASQSNGVSKALGCGVKRCTRPGAPSAVCSRAPRWITPRCRASRRRHFASVHPLRRPKERLHGQANVLRDLPPQRGVVAGRCRAVRAMAPSCPVRRHCLSDGVWLWGLGSSGDRGPHFPSPALPCARAADSVNALFPCMNHLNQSHSLG